jgi:hypothetical protein
MYLLQRAGRRPAALAALAVMMTIAISACGSSSKSSSTSSSSSTPSSNSSSTAMASKSPFTLLMVIDTSGPTKVYGTVDLASMQAAVKYWNGHGGILGHPITIKTLNDNGDATTAVSVATSYLTSNPKPDMIFAGTSAIDSAGLIPLVKRDGLLDVAVDDGDNVCQTNAQVTCPTAFVPAVDTLTQLKSVVSFMKSKGWKKIGILEEEDAFSESETGPLQSELTAAGLSSSVVTFSPTAVNVNPQISELQSDGVNATFVEGLAAAPGYAISGRAALGLINKMPYVFDAGAAAVDLTKLTPKTADLSNSWEEISRASDPYVSMPGRTLLLQYGTPAVSAQPLIVVPSGRTWRWCTTPHNSRDRSASVRSTMRCRTWPRSIRTIRSTCRRPSSSSQRTCTWTSRRERRAPMCSCPAARSRTGWCIPNSGQETQRTERRARARLPLGAAGYAAMAASLNMRSQVASRSAHEGPRSA